jgi:tRNA isopentenyl-2-thiomethyl-A-37 hydroxylase MiaE
MFELKFQTPAIWAEGIVEAMDVFLPDHATAEKYADPIQVQKRLDELLIAEAEIVSELPIRLALH